MTSEEAIYEFMNSFGIPAYAASSVPSDATYPYITYELTLGEFSEADTNIPVNVWYRTKSEAKPNAKVREMFDAIGYGGVTKQVDGGMIWIKRGRPWAQAVTVSGEDPDIKRRYVNVNVDFIVW